jgi:hypothetical protein
MYPPVRMTNSYAYSIKVNEALESYGARTHGSLARRVQRLKRFTDRTNQRYAEEVRLDHARMMANQEREERVQKRVRELHVEEKLRERTCPYNLRSRRGSVCSLNSVWRAIQNGFVSTSRR